MNLSALRCLTFMASYNLRVVSIDVFFGIFLDVLFLVQIFFLDGAVWIYSFRTIQVGLVFVATWKTGFKDRKRWCKNLHLGKGPHKLRSCEIPKLWHMWHISLPVRGHSCLECHKCILVVKHLHHQYGTNALSAWRTNVLIIPICLTSD